MMVATLRRISMRHVAAVLSCLAVVARRPLTEMGA
jgi:hypothetical protein